MQHRAHAFAGGVFDKADGIGGQAVFVQGLTEQFGNRAVAVYGLAAAAQDAGVAGFQAQGGGIGGYVRPRFVDDADDAERYAHFADLKAVRAGAEFVHFSHGVGQGGNLAQAFADVVYARVGKLQAVEHGGVQSFCFGVFHVLAVGGQDCGAVFVQ